MQTRELLIERLKKKSFDFKETDSRRCGYGLEVQTLSSHIRDLAAVMRDLGLYVVFVTAVHVRPGIQVVYQFAATDVPLRVMVRVPVPPDGTVLSIAGIFHGADWHEREVRDLFGLSFGEHPDLRPLILPDEDVDLAPLRKKEKKLKDIMDIFPGND